MPNRQDVGVEPVQNGIEQRTREHRRAEIAHAFGVDRVVRGAVLRTLADDDLELAL